jgi:SAM-dependent methyltransferase
MACGNGNFRLAGSGADVVATDFAPRMIDVARERSAAYEGRIEYRLVDATDESQPAALPGQFDAIVCLLKQDKASCFLDSAAVFQLGLRAVARRPWRRRRGHFRTAHWLSLATANPA